MQNNNLPEKAQENIIPMHLIRALEKLKKGSEAHSIVSARMNGKIISTNMSKEMLSKIYHKIGDCIKTLGHYNMENSEKTIQHIGEGILKVIKDKFPTLTDQEFYIIMDYGIRDKYFRKGDLRTVNIINIERWIIAYKTDAVVKNALQEFNKLAGEKEPEKILTPEEEQIILRWDCLNAFELFKEKQEISMASDTIFKQMKRDGYFKFLTKEQDIFIENEAEKSCRALIAADLNAGRMTKLSSQGHFADCDARTGYRYFRECRRAAIKLIFSLYIEGKRQLYTVEK